MPVEGTVDSMILRPLILARRSAFTRLTVEVVMDSRMPLMTMARSSLEIHKTSSTHFFASKTATCTSVFNGKTPG